MKYDIQLSQHFMLSEFLRSGEAERRGIDNTPSVQVISNLQHLCREVLEPLREYMQQPIVISSGYRCLELNRVLKSSDSSQHVTGEAADIHLPSIAMGRRYLDYLLQYGHYHQLIWEHDSNGCYWIHVSLKQYGQNSQQYIPNLLKPK